MTASFPLFGTLIAGDTAFGVVQDAICTATGIISVCGAYLRSEALLALTKGYQPKTPGRILTRWQMSDLVVGASDVAAFDVARELEWEFYIRLDFHGKVFAVPPATIVVGSANPTLSGFGLREGSNEEVCTIVQYSDSNSRMIDKLFAGALRMTPALLQDILSALDDAERNPSAQWPQQLLEKLNVSEVRTQLFVNECFLTDGSWLKKSDAIGDDAAAKLDCALLGFIGVPEVRKASPDLLVQRFRATALCRWLLDALEKESGAAYFGSLTARLHDSLLDDPAPSRRDVKDLLQNLIAWSTWLGFRDVIIDRPSHSQRLRLANRT